MSLSFRGCAFCESRGLLRQRCPPRCTRAGRGPLHHVLPALELQIYVLQRSVEPVCGVRPRCPPRDSAGLVSKQHRPIRVVRGRGYRVRNLSRRSRWPRRAASRAGRPTPRWPAGMLRLSRLLVCASAASVSVSARAGAQRQTAKTDLGDPIMPNLLQPPWPPTCVSEVVLQIGLKRASQTAGVPTQVQPQQEHRDAELFRACPDRQGRAAADERERRVHAALGHHHAGF